MSHSFPPFCLTFMYTFPALLPLHLPWFPSLSPANTLGHEPGTVLSCGEKAPRWCGKTGVPVGITYTHHKLAMPCLVPFGVVGTGEGRRPSHLQKKHCPNKQESTHTFPNTLDQSLVVLWGGRFLCLWLCVCLCHCLLASWPLSLLAS